VNFNHLNIVENIPRLQWACRRGMLELDLFLAPYLKESYLNLGLEDKKAFVDLLNYPDPEILSWLLGEVEPADLALIKIVNDIRHHAKNRI
jgi:antitoxin CptB